MSSKFTKEEAEFRKAMVRPYVTYGIVGFYIFATSVVGLLVLFENVSLDNGFLAIYTGLTTLTASIVSFWFGNRSSNRPEPKPEKEIL